MKRIIVFLMICSAAHGQGVSTHFRLGWSGGLRLVPITGYTKINASYEWMRGYFDSTFHIPNGTTPGLNGGYDHAGSLYYKSTDSSVYVYTGTAFRLLRGAGSGGITALTGDVTATGPGSAAATIGTNKVTNTMIRQSAGFSVIGRSATGTGNVADITASVSNTVLEYNGSSLAMRALVAGDLPGTSPYTWQQTLTAGSTLSSNNTVTMGATTFAMNQTNAFGTSTFDIGVKGEDKIQMIARTNATDTCYIVAGSEDGEAGAFSVAQGAAINARVFVNTQGAFMEAASYNGLTNNVKIQLSPSTITVSGLTNLSTQDRIIGILNSSGRLGTITTGTGISISSGVLSATGTGGTLTGFTTFGSTPNANGGSVSGANIILQPADGTNPGGVSTTTQTFAGVKTLATPSFTTGFTIGGAATSRKMMVGNGTNFVPSTETWAVPGTSGNVLRSDGTNWTSSTISGAGIIGGSIANTQVAVGNGTNTVAGSNAFTFASNLLTLTASTNQAGSAAAGLIVENTNAGGYANTLWKNDGGILGQLLATGSTGAIAGTPISANQLNFVSLGANGTGFYNSVGDFFFTTRGNATAQVGIVNGAVGIGNVSPTKTLDVTGTLGVSSTTTLGGAIIGASSQDVFNTTSTTVNAFGAATTLNIGKSAATVLNFGGHTSNAEFRFLEPSGAGTNYVGFKTPATLAGNTTYLLPNAFPAVTGYVLSSTDAGVMSWIAPGAGGSSLFPTTGTGTATGDVTGALATHKITIDNGTLYFNGTADAEVFKIDADGNTYLNIDAASGHVTFPSGDVQFTGNVGIGVSPTVALDVVATGTGVKISDFGNTANLFAIYNDNVGGNLFRVDGNTQYVLIDETNAGGALGIGTASPDAALQVIGTFHTGGTNTLSDLAGATNNRPVVASTAGVLSTLSGTVPLVVASADSTAKTATDTNVTSFTVGGSDGSFVITCSLDITAVAAGVLTTTVTWTDIHSNSRTGTFYGMGTTTAGIGALGSSNFAPMGEIRAKAGTTITVVETLTVGTATFDVSATIQQLR